MFAAEEGDDELIELCRRLDGLPLAIELAAARTKTLPVRELVERLDQRFELLRPSERSGAGLGAAIDSSYDLLFEEERRAFRRLSVFAGGATVEAAEAVCGPDALDLVARLVDRSMLTADTSGETARFRMLESLRAYGAERLAEEGELAKATAAHVAWCTELAERAFGPIQTADQMPWLERLDAEHDNLPCRPGRRDRARPSRRRAAHGRPPAALVVPRSATGGEALGGAGPGAPGGGGPGPPVPAALAGDAGG